MKKLLSLLAVFIITLNATAQKKVKINTNLALSERALSWQPCDTTLFPVQLVEDRYKYQYLDFICSTPTESNANIVLHNPKNKGLVDLFHAGQYGKFLGVNGSGVVGYYNDGSALINLTASSLATGIVPTARLGTGTANASSFLAGDGSWKTPVATVYNYVTRPLDSTTFTPSTTRPYRVYYDIEITCTSTISSPSSGSVTLQYYDGTNWIDTAADIKNSSTVTLAVVLNSVTTQRGTIAEEFPANTPLRLVSASTGTTAITWKKGKEVLYN